MLFDKAKKAADFLKNASDLNLDELKNIAGSKLTKEASDWLKANWSKLYSIAQEKGVADLAAKIFGSWKNDSKEHTLAEVKSAISKYINIDKL